MRHLRGPRLLDADLAAAGQDGQLGITATDVAGAIRAQSNQYAAGKIGQDPAPDGQALIYTVTAQGRLMQPEEFGNIVLRSSGPGGVLRVKDIARIELGAVSYDAYTTVDGRPTIGTASSCSRAPTRSRRQLRAKTWTRSQRAFRRASAT